MSVEHAGVLAIQRNQHALQTDVVRLDLSRNLAERISAQHGNLLG